MLYLIKGACTFMEFFNEQTEDVQRKLLILEDVELIASSSVPYTVAKSDEVFQWHMEGTGWVVQKRVLAGLKLERHTFLGDGCLLYHFFDEGQCHRLHCYLRSVFKRKPKLTPIE